jgi:hypothetical protein
MDAISGQGVKRDIPSSLVLCISVCILRKSWFHIPIIEQMLFKAYLSRLHIHVVHLITNKI